MRALILESPGPIESLPLKARELKLPEPGVGQARVKVSVCGLCRTDLHEIEGEIELPKLPVIPGHQIVGVVDAVGRNVVRLRMGDRVGVPWLHHACGTCEFCRRGDENLCDKARFTGYHVDGGYAEYMLASEAFCCKMPEGVADEQAAPLLCAGIIGYRALRIAGMIPGDALGLFGFGASAHIALQIARHQGCRVRVFTRSQEHRELAKRLGADWTGSPSDEPPGLLDRAVLFAPAGAIVPQALARLKKGGTLALAGIHIDEIPKMPYSLLYGERVLRSITAATRRDAEELLSFSTRIPIKTEVQRFRFEEANDALIQFKASRVNGAGVLMI